MVHHKQLKLIGLSKKYAREQPGTHTYGLICAPEPGPARRGPVAIFGAGGVPAACLCIKYRRAIGSRFEAREARFAVNLTESGP